MRSGTAVLFFPTLPECRSSGKISCREQAASRSWRRFAGRLLEPAAQLAWAVAQVEQAARAAPLGVIPAEPVGKPVALPEEQILPQGGLAQPVEALRPTAVPPRPAVPLRPREEASLPLARQAPLPLERDLLSTRSLRNR